MQSSSDLFKEDNVLTIKTVQVAPFRILMTALKEILVETNIVFQEDGIKITSMDKSQTILVYLSLDALKFQQFECKQKKIVIGVNIPHLYKLINQMDNDETLTMYIEKANYTDGIVSYLGLKYENGNIKQCKTYKLKLIEPDLEETEYPNVNFSSIINLPSSDFQKIIRDLTAISEKIEIKSVGNELIFKSSGGQFAEVIINRAESNDSLEFSLKPDSSKIIQGEFSLKNLGYFIKCTNLCPQIELYLENDLPLVIKYNVADLGEIKLCLSPLPSS